jgi:hypothetical protein
MKYGTSSRIVEQRTINEGIIVEQRSGFSGSFPPPTKKKVRKIESKQNKLVYELIDE